MKYILFLSLSIVVLLFGCNLSKGKSGVFNLDNLATSQYVIDINKDTVLQTQNGALLKIQKGTLKPENGNSVTIEIKEAFSISQIVQGALLTQSKDGLLSSGGMIYVNAVAGQNVTITKAITVAIPSDHLEKNMELYKGNVKDDGTVDWTDPKPLPENKQLSTIEKGKILFESKCISCHQIGKDATGPNLANLKRRAHFGEEGGYPYMHYINYLTSDSGVYLQKDTLQPIHWTRRYHPENMATIYACNVKKIFGSMGPHFPDLTGEDNSAIVNYIQNESERRDLPLPSHAYLDQSIDSCEKYNETVKRLKEEKRHSLEKKKGLIKDNGSLVNKIPDSTWGNSNNDLVGTPDKVSPIDYGAVYYQFTIESFGWYNVDMMIKNVDGVQESELFARIIGQFREKIKIYIIIPSVKVYGEGGPTGRNPDEYAFYNKNGVIPLPQNVKAYILAVTETDESIAYSIKEFSTSKQQQIDVSLLSSTKDEFREAIKKLNLDRLHIRVDDSKNADQIRKTESDIKIINQQIKEAEKLMPVRCDCSCGITDQIPAN